MIREKTQMLNAANTRRQVSVQRAGEKSDCGLNFSPRKQNSKIATKKKKEQIHITAIICFQFLEDISADLATLTLGRSLSERRRQIICDHESTFNHDSECGDVSQNKEIIKKL